MELFLTLLLAHLLADFPLQTNQLFRFKHTSSLGLLVHVLVYGVTTLVLTSFQRTLLPWVIGLGLFHFTLDWVKLQLEAIYNPVLIYTIDQLLHLASLVFVAEMVAQQQFVPFAGFFPIQLLWTAVAILLILALMILVWIWANTIDAQRTQDSVWIRWARSQLLGLEQRIGWGLVFVLCISMLFSFERSSQITQLIASMIGF